jgi:putative FmdB family regulatory protein
VPGPPMLAPVSLYTLGMPLYEFACSECGARFDRLQNASASAPACPSCDSGSVSRLISLIAGLGGSASSSSSSTPVSAGGCGCGGNCACGR